MTLLDGKALAAEIQAAVKERAAKLAAAGKQPTLAIVVPNEDDSSAWYVRSLGRLAEKSGVTAEVHSLGAAASEAEIAEVLTRLAAATAIDGIILQTPLPAGVSQSRLAALIPAAKDVDGVTPESLGRIMASSPTFAPATAEAVMRLLAHHGVELSGRRAVVVGRSTVVGRPLSMMLLQADATVTVAHSRTRALEDVTREADVVVMAVGRPEMLVGSAVRPGAVVVDVGTNVTEDGKLIGDVQRSSVEAVAGALSPVPGGVGPVTSALLMEHVVMAAEAAGS